MSSIKKLDSLNSTQTMPLTSQKVIEIFESPYTEQLNDRKANMIIKFCNQRQDGFFYEELNDLIKMVEYCTQSLNDGVQEMQQSLISILQCASLPFKKNKASDELNYAYKLPLFLKNIKVFFKEQSYSFPLISQAIQFINSFAQEGISEIFQMEDSLSDKKKGFSTSPMQKLKEEGTKNLIAINKADMVEDLIFAFKNNQLNYETLLPILETITSCVLNQILCQKFVEQGILEDIMIVVFNCEDFRSLIIRQSMEILWNAIEVQGVQAIKNFANEEIILNIKVFFENLMKNGYRLEDKCLRNEFLILVNYLSRDSAALEHFHTKKNDKTFMELLLFYSTIDEMTFYNEPIKTNKLRAYFGTNSEDLEFKKLIWSGVLMAIQSNQKPILDSVINSNFTLSILLYIDPMANSYAVNRWSQPQIREIQLHCLSIISNLILYLKEDFIQKNGLFSLTKFLTNNCDPERKEKCLRAFCNASLFEEEYKIKITEEGVLDNLIDLLQNQEDNSIEIRELCFSIVSNLCKVCVKNKKLFRVKGGLDLIIASLKDINVAKATRYALYTVAILDCLWNAILGDRKNEQLFLDNEGVQVLLEFIEECDPLHLKMSLSCLGILIENPKSIQSFCEWSSSKTSLTAIQLLQGIYEQEDKKYGVQYVDGVIANRKKPLNPKPKIEEPPSDPVDRNKNAGTEAYLTKRIKDQVKHFDLRAIIFCIVLRTSFQQHDLNIRDKQKIEIIQNYPHFKMGEIWNDIKDNLKFKPTSDDYHWMMTNLEEFDDRISKLVQNQEQVMRQEKEDQEENLRRFYETVKQNKIIK